MTDCIHHAAPPIESSRPVQAAETAAKAVRAESSSPNPDAKLSIKLRSALAPSSSPRKEPMLKALPATFSWPQLITALIGGGIALLIVPVIRKALHR